MPSEGPSIDGVLRARLQCYTQTDHDYWSFRRGAARDHAHAYFQYPAMMVPRMLRELMGTVLETVPDARRVLDPFAGSGTTLVEAMLNGCDFTGIDINPLAVLLCLVKAGPFDVPCLEGECRSVSERIDQDRSLDIDVDFPGIRKWFTSGAIRELCRIRRAIRNAPQTWVRRFLWVAMAETVRLTSNSRTSTYKLHVRPPSEIQERDVSPVRTFRAIIARNLGHMATHRELLDRQGLLRENRYVGQVVMRHADAVHPTQLGDVSESDLLVTSPPYGDNASTVPYGQHSFLPLQWTDLRDIDPRVDGSWVNTTHTIDARSLGGSWVRAVESAQHIEALSAAYRQVMCELRSAPRDRAVRVAAFCRDLDRSVGPVLTLLHAEAYMIWTVGNRRVGGIEVPVDRILCDLLEARGCTVVTAIRRRIPVKRMAVRNSIARTMGSETILVCRKGGA